MNNKPLSCRFISACVAELEPIAAAEAQHADLAKRCKPMGVWRVSRFGRNAQATRRRWQRQERVAIPRRVRGREAIEARMWTLPAQPVSNAGGQPKEAVTKGRNQRPKNPGNLYLLPIVDRRYFWQFCGSDSYTTESHFGWNALKNAVIGKLAKGDQDFEIDQAKYFKPDPDQLLWVHTNAALHIDAIAASTGGQLVAFPTYGDNDKTTLYHARWEDYPRPDSEIATNINGTRSARRLPAGRWSAPYRPAAERWNSVSRDVSSDPPKMDVRTSEASGVPQRLRHGRGI